MHLRALFLIAVIAIAMRPSYGIEPIVHNGSSIARAIPLKQRGPRAVEEEMSWMMKMYRYTPVLSQKAEMIDAIRKGKAGKQNSENVREKSRSSPWASWDYTVLEHRGQWCSCWSFQTPRGPRTVYFDTGAPVNIAGEQLRQVRARAVYMDRAIDALKLQLGI
jgi:hypothetical protein